MPVVRDNNIVQELGEIFRMINDYDAVLETGHISPEECFIVTEAARNAGVRKIVITHPEFRVAGMTLEEQKRIVKDYGVILEHEYARPTGGGIYRKNLEVNAQAMREIGCEHFIVATDSGQPQNPYWYESLAEYIDYLHGTAHFTREETDTMTKTNPAQMPGIIPNELAGAIAVMLTLGSVSGEIGVIACGFLTYKGWLPEPVYIVPGCRESSGP